MSNTLVYILAPKNVGISWTGTLREKDGLSKNQSLLVTKAKMTVKSQTIKVEGILGI